MTPSVMIPPLRRDWTLPDRVAYVVSHSFPYSSNGYAVRTHQVAAALCKAGHDVIVFNRPGRPWRIDGFSADTKVPLDQTINGVRYVFLPLVGDPTAAVEPQLRQAEEALAEAFAVFRPAMVLAASNWETAEPARRVAARRGCAFFYEQRGFWEMSRALHDPAFADSDDFRLHQARDTAIAQAARGVFTLNAAMAAELTRRGVPADTIHFVPNGLPDVRRPTPKARASAAQPGGPARARIGCTARFLLAYIGSLSAYEGVEDLLHLVAHLRRPGAGFIDVAAMIVGSSAPSGLISGPHPAQHPRPREAQLQALAHQLGVAAHVHFVPQVPESQIGPYYAMTDAIILPRHHTPVTALVPPIKPYAAAAYGVPVFMTDLPPLAEIGAEIGIGACLFAQGDIAGLAAAVTQRLQAGGRATGSADLPKALNWAQRVRPMAEQFAAIASIERQRLAQVAAAGQHGGGFGLSQAPRFDTLALPRVGLAQLVAAPTPLHQLSQTIACLGPGHDLRAAAPVIGLTRVNILDVLATAEPGRFVIDWAGLETESGEWRGLWSADAMRLNRQIMDACRIALDRGWQVQVIGPVSPAAAPLFRTVAGVMQDIASDAAPDPGPYSGPHVTAEVNA